MVQRKKILNAKKMQMNPTMKDFLAITMMQLLWIV